MITISGVLSRITYQNPDNHYTVCRLHMEKTADSFTAVGHLAGVNKGETLELTGKWVSHAKYGDQFQISSFQVRLPATVSGIRQYLGSGLIKGISSSLADRIVERFQENTLDIIENEPEKLLDVSGIGKAKKRMIERAWNQHHAVRRVMQFLQENGVEASHAGNILGAYGSKALEIMQTRPFFLARDIPGLGFRRVDAIARASGVDADDEERLKACLFCHLVDQEQDGHVFCLEADLISHCARTAGVEPDCFSSALEGLVREKLVRLVDSPNGEDADGQDQISAESGNRVYEYSLFRAEKGIAARILAMLSLPVLEESRQGDRENQGIAEQVFQSLAVQLSSEQLDVMSQVLQERVVIITGGPGTGKTTLIRALCSVFSRQNLRVVLGAPTGRAARRLSEVTGKKASTLHKLLGFDPDSGDFVWNARNPLDLDVCVVDEVSMVDTRLMYHLFDALPAMSRVILVGDSFQLPSVGPGNVLTDMMDSGRIRVCNLTRIFRQAEKSPIVRHAHSLRNGQMPDVKETGDARDDSGENSGNLSQFYFIETQDAQKVADTIVELSVNRIPGAFPHIDEIQVLTPMHRGQAGTINLNQQLQEALNPSGDAIKAHGMTFRARDKVMHLKNNYEKDVFNGDIGVVSSVSIKDGTLDVDYDGRMVTYEVPELDELTLAYAVSIHKSQGSEYKAVIIALTMGHSPLLQRNLIYTAITRGKELVIVVGSTAAFTRAFENNRTNYRRSGLKDLLREGL